MLPLLARVLEAFDHWLVPQFGDEGYLDYDRDEISVLTSQRDVLWDKLAGADFLTDDEKRAALGYGPR